MSEFDDLERKQKQEQLDKEQLARETMTEWEVALKGFVSEFALNGKGIGSDKFQWQNNPSQRSASLILNNVAATLYDSGEQNGIPQRCGVLIGRKPLGPNQVWADDKSPIEPRKWSLEPTVENGEFLWLVEKLNRKFSSAQLADTIAKQVGECHVAYQKAYANWGM
jgi:hypothetical protein